MSADTLGPWRWPALFAHRGGGALAPENTLAGIRLAAALGCSGVEFDVMLSLDSVPVLIHDETVDRTTNGSGRVAGLSSGELARLDAGCKHGKAFSGEALPTFEAAARLCIELGMSANVEIKPARGFEAETGALVASLSQRLWGGANGKPLLSSFSETALIAARQTAPRLSFGLLVEEIPTDAIERCRRLGCVCLHANVDAWTEARIEALKAAGLFVLGYTENDPGRARRWWTAGADALVTDRPDLLLSDDHVAN